MESCIQKLEQGETFCFETVFSHPSKIDLVLKAKAMGYTVNLIFIHLNNVHLNFARVSQRIGEGGHSVPAAKIQSRIPRTVDNVRQVVYKVDNCRLLDNSSSQNPYSQIATIKSGKIVTCADPLPDWAKQVLQI